MVKIEVIRKPHSEGIIGNMMSLREEAMQKTLDAALPELKSAECPEHPGFENIIDVDLDAPEQYSVRVACCSGFQSLLEDAVHRLNEHPSK